MAEIRPLRGWRYREETVGSIRDLIAPPYDIIGPEQAARLRARSPHNIVRLELPEGSEDPAESENRYARAASLSGAWRDERVLALEEQPALYLYAQDFRLPSGAALRRLGLLAALRLEPYERGVVLPHEQTFPKHREDRRRLLSAARAQFSPIMGLYPGGPDVRATLEQAAVAPAVAAATDDEGVTHSLWVRSDRDWLAWARVLLAERQVFIADGHHRYETALRYQQDQGHGLGARWSDYLLVYLVAMEDPGLALMPTHRLVRGLPAASGEALREPLARALPAQPHAGDPAAEAAPGTLRLLAGDREALTLRLPEGGLPASLAPERTAAWRSLEAVALHHWLLPAVLEGGEGTEVVYTRDAAEARARVASGEFQAAFLLPAPRVEQLRTIALAGERMPEKTTYFWPKAWAGLVIYGEESV